MTRKPYIESSISALQNRGGYRCHAVIDNPLNRIFRALSWLFAAASVFVCSATGSALGVVAELPSRHLFCFCQWSGKYPVPLHLTPYTLLLTCHLPATYLHRKLIGTSSEPDRNLIGTSPKDYREILKGYIGDILGIYKGFNPLL